ncbi:MAG: peptidoglycan-binding domain-containing protein [Patescibacteria group bacterium]
MSLNRQNLNKFSFKAIISVIILAFIIGPFTPMTAYADISNTSVVGDTDIFSSPGNYTWTVPSGIASVKVKTWGAGGSAGNGEKITDSHRSGLGGGGGAYSEKTITVTSGEQYFITIGAGGQGIKDVSKGRQGNSGGDTKFEGSFGIMIAGGGIGGTSYTGHGNSTADLGFGGEAIGGDVNSNGSSADPYIEFDSNPYASKGGSSPNGGVGGSRGRCGRDGTCPGSDPSSPLAIDGSFPGGGGGGSDVGSGGYGANGQVIIEVFSIPPVVPPVTPPITPPPITPPPTTDAKPIGYLDNVSCSIFNGWAYDPDDTNAQIDVHFYSGGDTSSGIFIGSIKANRPRSDVNQNMAISGDHGFSFPIPNNLLDGKTYAIYAYGINSNTSTNLNNSLLTQSPLSITGCTVGSGGTNIVTPPITPPPVAVNGITYISFPSSVIAGTQFNVQVKNSGTKIWNTKHDLGISKSNLSENISLITLSTTAVNDNKRITFTAPAVPGSYVLRAVEQGADWFGGNQSFMVTAASGGGNITPPITPPITVPATSVVVNPIVNTSIINTGGNTNQPLRDLSLSLPSGLSTSETSTTVTFTAVLTSVPGTDVIFPVTSSNWNEGTTSPITRLVFTVANWNTPQTVTVTGINDVIDDGDVAYTVIIGPSFSNDANWNNLAAKSVSLINTDDDPAPAGGSGSGSGSLVNTISTVITSSGGGGGGGSRRHCTGFGCPVVSVSTDIIPGDIWITLDNVNTSGSSVLGPEKTCPAGNFVKTFLRIGIDNNPDEVRKLQYFLNTYEKAGLVVNGDFDSATEEAVKAMQIKHAEEILAPWGITEPTGIVYITTTGYINTVYCKDNPEFKDNESIKDIPINPEDFEGVIGQATSSISNIAGVIGSLSDRLRSTLKDIHLYALLILLLLLLGTYSIIYGIVIKDIKPEERDTSFMRGSALLCIGSVLNVLNTLSFILNQTWFVEKTDLTLSWLLGLDLANLLLVIVICLSVLVVIYSRTSKMVR